MDLLTNELSSCSHVLDATLRTSGPFIDNNPVISFFLKRLFVDLLLVVLLDYYFQSQE